MEELKILISILIFWFCLSSFLTFAAADTSLQDITYNNNDSYAINASLSLNFTSQDINNPLSTPINFWNMLSMMFTARIPNYLLPSSIDFIISFINWILFITFIICLWRVIMPTTG